MIPDRPENAATDWQTADAWFTPLRFAAILAALIVACFPNVIFGLETFYFRDFGAFGYPLAAFHREAFWRGEIPLWNPLNDCGLPFLAQWNTLTLYPPALFYLIFPLSWSLGVFCLLHLFLAGMGMYFLAYRWTGNRLAASIGGVIFAFNGLTWYSLMWPNNISALGWMPWVVLAMERAWREGGTRRIALAALAGALQMLAGAPEVIILTWGTVGALWLAQMIQGETPRVRMLGRAVIAGILVAGLAAAQLLPFLDLLGHSQRDTSFGGSSWAMPLTGWANYLVPLFHMQPSLRGPPSQVGQYWTGSYFLGAGTVALALLTIWRVRNPRTWVLMALAAFSLIMALGGNTAVYPWVKRVLPQIGFMRFPIKFVVLATFVIPLLAASAVAWLQGLPQEKWRVERRKIVWLAVTLFGLIGVIAWCAVKYSTPPADAPVDRYDVPGTLMCALVRAAFLAAILGCLLAFRQTTTTKLQLLLRLCLILLFWFDVFTHSTTLSPTVARWVFQPDAIRQYLKWEGQQARAGESRAMETPASMKKMLFGTVEEAAADFNGRRLALFTDFNLLDHASKVGGFYSLYLREANALTAWLYGATNDLSPLKDYIGVSHTSNPTNALEWVYRDTFMPLITAGQAPVFANDDTTLDHLLGDNFEPRRTIYLPPEARSSISVTGRTEVKITSRPYTAQKFGAEVEASSPAIISVAQPFYHPWRAYVDERPVRLWRANYAFQAFEVPAGRHQVKLVYEDRVFQCGAVISLATLVLCVIGCFCGRSTAVKPTLVEARELEAFAK